MVLPELIASAWTTAGNVVPHLSNELSPEGFSDRVEAATQAGFVGMGFVHADISVIRRTLGLGDAKAVLDRHGVKYVEVEMLMNWHGGGALTERARQTRDELLEAAAAWGAIHVKVGCDTGPEPYPFEALAEDFRDLCERAEGAGTRIALEFLPFASIRTPDEAMALIAAADHLAGGMLIDIWHVERGKVPLVSLRDIPLDRIFGVELDDAPASISGSLLEDTLFNRRLCGDGDFAVRDFIQVLRSQGYEGPWGVEILSDAFRSLPMPIAVQQAYSTTLAQFDPSSGV